MTPKRADEVLDGGSIYRVIKGVIVARQPILAIETQGEGQAKRCQLVVSETLVRVAPTPRRPSRAGAICCRKTRRPISKPLGGRSHAPKLAAELALARGVVKGQTPSTTSTR